jgi:hypothetical protein
MSGRRRQPGGLFAAHGGSHPPAQAALVAENKRLDGHRHRHSVPGLRGDLRQEGRDSVEPPAESGPTVPRNLLAGELFEVKSERDILATLDANGRCKGLLWMPSMARLCGKRYRVRKRVERIMLESSGEIRKIRNTVLLEGATCENLYGCDRSCFHFWREIWLKRVSDE